MEDKDDTKETQGERWSREKLKYIGGVPWSSVKEGGVEGGQMKTEVVVMDKDYKERCQREEHVAVPRAMYITKGDLEEHGYTAGCPGCISILRGRPGKVTLRAVGGGSKGEIVHSMMNKNVKHFSNNVNMWHF